MKSVYLMGLALFACIATANAQKSVYSYEDTQARALDMVSKGYVKPLTVEVSVDETRGRMMYEMEMTPAEVESMKNDVTNIRAKGVFEAARAWKCDVVVAPTFHLFTTNTGYKLEVVGFAGSFKNWKTMTDADIQWISLTQTISTDNRGQIEAVIKSTETK